MPYYSTKTEAGVALPKKVRERLFESPNLRDPKTFMDKARPTTSELTQLRPSLSKESESHPTIEHSLIMSLISFTGSMLLHVIVVWLHHHYKHHHRTNLFWCGLFCPKMFKAMRRNSCSKAAPAYSDALSPMNVPAPDYSAKVRAPTRMPSMATLHETLTSVLCTYEAVISSATPAANAPSPSTLPKSNSTPNMQHAS